MFHPRRRLLYSLARIGCVTALLGLGSLNAAPVPRESAAELFATGRSLLASEMPALAALPLKQALSAKGDDALNAAQTRSARILLGSAELLSQEPENALEVLQQVKDLGSGEHAAAEHILHAQVLAALQRWEDALAICARAGSHGAELPAGLRFIAALTCGESELGRGHLAEAETQLREARKLAADGGAPPQGQARARFLLALTRLRQGEAKKCLELLEGMVPLQTSLLGKLDQSAMVPLEAFALPAAAKEILLLEAEANAAQGQFQPAARLCDLALRHPSGLNPDQRLQTALRKAWYEESTGLAEEAEDTLLQAIREHDDPLRLETAFSHLLALYTRHDLNSQISLGPFLSGGDALRGPYASFLTAFLTGRAGAFAQAEEMLNALANTYPTHPLAADARLLRVRMAQRGTAPSQIAESDEKPSEEYAPLFAFETALGWLAEGEFAKAMRGFEEASKQPGRLGLSARYNMALAALESRNQQEFRRCLETLEKLPAAVAQVRSLRIASAAWNLRRGHLDTARSELSSLVPAEPKARLLLAELNLRQGKPKVAYELAQSVAETPAAPAPAPAEGNPATADPDAVKAEEAEYIAFWALAAELGAGADAVIEKARAYLEKYPATELSQLIRFKLAELYFQQSAFAEAQREFETLSEQTKDADLKEVADFQSARAAALTMSERGLKTALATYAAIAKNGGNLRDDAQLEQAALLRDSLKYGDAEAIYESLLKGRKPGDEVRLAALQGLAQCLFSEAGGVAIPTAAGAAGAPAVVKDEGAPALTEASREKLERCLSVCEQLLEGAESRPAWRNFALYLQGRCWQEMGDLDQSLICYTKVITKPPGGGAEPEFLWFYRAGFGAVEILEARKQLKTALSVLTILKSAGGPRAPEAEERMKMIRLKNFIWDDPALDPDTRPRGN